MEKNQSWPVNIEEARSFAVYCLSVRKVKPDTAKGYLANINLAHSLQNLKSPDIENDKILKMIFAGAKNVQIETKLENCRRVMTLPTLMILSHRIAEKAWSELKKQTVWTACTTGFFTSARMGELLAETSTNFDCNSTLLWKHVKFLHKDDILIRLPFTKTKKVEGDFIDLFSFDSLPCCPVAALKRLSKIQYEQNVFDLERPVFLVEKNCFLTTRELNAILKDLLKDIFIPGENSISCQSFRAGIPNAIAKFPEKNFVSDVKDWGAWTGDSYKRYLRLKKDQRKFLYSKIVTVLLNDCKLL